MKLVNVLLFSLFENNYDVTDTTADVVSALFENLKRNFFWLAVHSLFMTQFKDW